MCEAYEKHDIVCPYCRYGHNGCDYPGEYDDDEFTCDECGKKFLLTIETSVFYHTMADCELNGEAHQWSEYTDHPGREYCTKCQKVRIIPGSPAQESKEQSDC